MQQVEDLKEDVCRLQKEVTDHEKEITKLTTMLESQRDSLVKERDEAFENGFSRGFSQGTAVK